MQWYIHTDVDLSHTGTSSSHDSAKTHIASPSPQRTFNHGSGAATVLSWKFVVDSSSSVARVKSKTA